MRKSAGATDLCTLALERNGSEGEIGVGRRGGFVGTHDYELGGDKKWVLIVVYGGICSV
jgi:hypothetical protein